MCDLADNPPGRWYNISSGTVVPGEPCFAKKARKALAARRPVKRISGRISALACEKVRAADDRKGRKPQDEQGTCYVWHAGQGTVLTDGVHPNDTDTCHSGGALSVFEGQKVPDSTFQQPSSCDWPRLQRRPKVSPVKTDRPCTGDSWCLSPSVPF